MQYIDDLTPQLINEILNETRWPPFYDELVAKHGREVTDQILEEATAETRERLIAAIPPAQPKPTLLDRLLDATNRFTNRCDKLIR